MALDRQTCVQVARHNIEIADSSVARYQWTAWLVANDMALNDELTLALMEAPWAETHWENYANDGRRGPEDGGKGGARSTDAQLATAAQSLGLPHDAVGTDHASVGILQQQVGAGFNWGSVQDVMNPEHALRTFAEHALASPQRGHGAHKVAQSVQRSAHRDGSNYRAFEGQAQALIDRMKTSCEVAQ